MLILTRFLQWCEGQAKRAKFPVAANVLTRKVKAHAGGVFPAIVEFEHKGIYWSWERRIDECSFKIHWHNIPDHKLRKLEEAVRLHRDIEIRLHCSASGEPEITVLRRVTTEHNDGWEGITARVPISR
jgi:hypothetical protein